MPEDQGEHVENNVLPSARYHAALSSKTLCLQRAGSLMLAPVGQGCRVAQCCPLLPGVLPSPALPPSLGGQGGFNTPFWCGLLASPGVDQ